jgi:hypothetical protein
MKNFKVASNRLKKAFSFLNLKKIGPFVCFLYPDIYNIFDPRFIVQKASFQFSVLYSITGHQHRCRCRRHRHFGIHNLNPIPEDSGIGPGSPYSSTGPLPTSAFFFIPVADWPGSGQSSIAAFKKIVRRELAQVGCNSVNSASTFRHHGQSDSAGYGLIRHCEALLDSFIVIV